MPGDDVTIRAARAGDVEAIVAFWSAEAEPTVADDRISLARLFERDTEALLVAERDGAIIGDARRRMGRLAREYVPPCRAVGLPARGDRDGFGASW